MFAIGVFDSLQPPAQSIIASPCFPLSQLGFESSASALSTRAARRQGSILAHVQTTTSGSLSSLLTHTSYCSAPAALSMEA